MLNILLFYLKRKRMGYFYFTERRIKVGLSISTAAHLEIFPWAGVKNARLRRRLWRVAVEAQVGLVS
jgi:hypothetical protein